MIQIFLYYPAAGLFGITIMLPLYWYAIKSKVSFNPPVIVEVTRITSNYKDIENFVYLVFDEIKVKSNLVFTWYNEEFIGFVDLMDPELNFSSFKGSDQLTTHAVVRGSWSSFKFSSDYFATHCVTSYKLTPTFCRVWSILELSWKLHVTATVSDGVSPTTMLYQMHYLLCDNENKDVVYRSIKLYICYVSLCNNCRTL